MNMMNNRFGWFARVAVLFFVLVPGQLWGEEGQRSLSESTRSCCLWKISTPTNTVYFLGSIHMLKREHFPLQPAIYQALREAKHVVFEVNPETLSEDNSSLEMLKLGVWTNGKTLRNQLSHKSYETAKTQLAARGYRIDQFESFKPWFLALTITAMEFQRLGFDPTYGVDTHVFERAKQQGKRIGALETFRDQIHVFNGMSLRTQELFVLESLSELAMMEKEVNGLIQAWLNGEAEGLEVMLTSMKEYPEVFEALITRRNQNWLPQIQSFLNKADSYLVVVGAMHLLGEDGLLATLKAKGFLVEQM